MNDVRKGVRIECSLTQTGEKPEEMDRLDGKGGCRPTNRERVPEAELPEGRSKRREKQNATTEMERQLEAASENELPVRTPMMVLDGET